MPLSRRSRSSRNGDCCGSAQRTSTVDRRADRSGMWGLCAGGRNDGAGRLRPRQSRDSSLERGCCPVFPLGTWDVPQMRHGSRDGTVRSSCRLVIHVSACTGVMGHGTACRNVSLCFGGRSCRPRVRSRMGNTAAVELATGPIVPPQGVADHIRGEVARRLLRGEGSGRSSPETVCRDLRNMN